MTDKEFKTSISLLGFREELEFSGGTKYRYIRKNLRIYTKPNSKYFIAGISPHASGDKTAEEVLEILEEYYGNDQR